VEIEILKIVKTLISSLLNYIIRIIYKYNHDQLIDENLGELPNIDITGTGALTCDIIDEDLEATLGLLHLLDGDVNLDLLREDEEIVETCQFQLTD
jgi:hypothetical protein